MYADEHEKPLCLALELRPGRRVVGIVLQPEERVTQVLHARCGQFNSPQVRMMRHHGARLFTRVANSRQAYRLAAAARNATGGQRHLRVEAATYPGGQRATLE
jgi:hypothetical protein